MTMSESADDLTSVLSVSSLGPGRWSADVPDGWQQGRGAFGGLVLGMVARAILASDDDEQRSLRSISGEIVGPVQPGVAEIEILVLRRGSGVSTLSALFRQGGEVLAHATGVLAKARADATSLVTLSSPSMPPWEAQQGRAIPDAMAPRFVRHFDMRSTGAVPFSGGRDPSGAGWVRATRTPSRLGAPEVIAYADAWWPAIFPVWTTVRPMATLAFTLQMVADPATLVPEEPLFHRSTMLCARDGYSVEQRELWTKAGTLVALNQQTFVTIK